MGLTLKTDDKPVMIFRQEREYNGNIFYSYSIGVSSKDKDGNLVGGFIDCTFKKGVTVENKTKIFIKNAFPTVSQGKDRTFTKWMITDFELEDQVKDDFMAIPDGEQTELPWD